jgi:hypothetical protein
MCVYMCVGYYGPAGANTCALCPAGSYCSGGTVIEACTGGLTSSAGSIDISDCDTAVCPLGTYGMVTTLNSSVPNS